jgi:hypothetical protein
MDWYSWHEGYEAPGGYEDEESSARLMLRLRIVQERIREALGAAPPGPVRALSLCAGQGRDLIGALAEHPRRDDVCALLVELDERNCAQARAAAGAAGLTGISARTADAEVTDSFLDAVPVDLLLLCGLFENITRPDISRTIGYTARLCRTGGVVVWTRSRIAPDAVPGMRADFAAAGFEEVWVSPPEIQDCVGAHRYRGSAADPPLPGDRLFEFVGWDALNAGCRARSTRRNA